MGRRPNRTDVYAVRWYERINQSMARAEWNVLSDYSTTPTPPQLSKKTCKVIVGGIDTLQVFTDREG